MKKRNNKRNKTQKKISERKDRNDALCNYANPGRHKATTDDINILILQYSRYIHIYIYVCVCVYYIYDVHASDKNSTRSSL